MMHRAPVESSDRTWRPVAVIQRSAVDCGLAAVESVLRGYRLPVPSLTELARLAGTTVNGTSMCGEAIALDACGLKVAYVVEPWTGFALAHNLQRGPIIADVQGLTWGTKRPWRLASSEAETIPGHRRRLAERASMPEDLQTTAITDQASHGGHSAGHAVVLWRVHRHSRGVEIDVLCPSQGRRAVPFANVIRYLRVIDGPALLESWVIGTVETIGRIADDLEIRKKVIDLAIDRAAGWRGLAHILACLEHVWRERELGRLKSTGAVRRALEALLALEPGTPPVDPSTWHTTGPTPAGLMRSTSIRYVAIHGRK